MTVCVTRCVDTDSHMRSWKSCSCVGVTVTAPPTVFVGSVFSVSASHAAVLYTTQQTAVTSHS